MHEMNSLRAVDLNLLVILEALLSERHLSRAAERLHMSQPAVSHALARLRHLLGDPLLLRGKGGFQPTARALELARPLAEALQSVRSVLGGAVFEAATAQRVFRLAMSDYGAALILPALLRRLRVEAPGIDLAVSYASRPAVIAGVQDGEIDLALGVFPQLPEHVTSRNPVRGNIRVRARSGQPGARRNVEPGHLSGAPARAGGVQRGRHGGRSRCGPGPAGPDAPHRRACAVLDGRTGCREGDGLDPDGGAARLAGKRGARGWRCMPAPFAIAPFAFETIRHRRTDGDAGIAWLRAAIAQAAEPG